MGGQNLTRSATGFLYKFIFLPSSATDEPKIHYSCMRFAMFLN